MTFVIESKRLKSIKVEVKSSLIDYMQYSKEDFSLIVRYKSGRFHKKRVKRYEEVSPEQFFELLNCESIGKAFIQLKDKIRYR